MEQEGVLIVVSGPSGAGKGTICRHLLNNNDKLCYSISATTRLPRAGETNGVDYWFINKEKFTEMLKNEELLEWALVYNNYYGTPRGYVLEKLREGIDILLEIDIQGAMQIKEKFPRGVFIYIVPPSFEEISKRIQKRETDSLTEIENRLKCFKDEVALANNYDYLIINDEVENALKKIEAIILAEKCLIKRNLKRIERILESLNCESKGEL